MTSMMEERLTTRVVHDYEVVVCGGGFGGISAALAAARHGKKTLLIERQFMLGGLGTAGLVTIYLPLCDGFGRQVSFGIAEELLRLSVSYGAEAHYPKNWLDGEGTRTEKDPRFEVQYNPQLFAILAEKLLLDAGVDILYGTCVVAVHKTGDTIDCVITEGKSGRVAYAVQSVVDATGDCDVAAMAGAPTENFKQGNVLAGWYYSFGRDGYKLHSVGACDIPEEKKKTRAAKMEYLSDRRFGGLDSAEISEFVQLSHGATMQAFLKARQSDPTVFPVTMATVPQLRMTRRIVGEYVLSESEMHQRFADSVGMVSNWKQRGPVYEVPFRTLYSSAVKNLVTVGRCTSVTETLWDVMRVIPCCAVTGQAAGTASALSTDFSALDVRELQRALATDGVRLHEDELAVGSH